MTRDNVYLFTRMSLAERGHTSNSFSLNPVRSIKLWDDKVQLEDRSGVSTYSWSDFREVQLVHKKTLKAFGWGGMEFQSRTMIVATDSKTFSFDVSDNYPDFEGSDKLVELFTEATEVEMVFINNRPWVKDTLLGIIAVGLIYLIAKHFE